MKHFSTSAAALVSAGILSACGGGSDPAPDPAHFSGPDDSMATRISAATSLEDAATFETTAKILKRDFEADTTTQLPDQPMTVRLFRTSPTAAPTLVIETEDGEFSFGPEDLNRWGDYSKENSGSWGLTDGWLAHANGYRIREDGDFTSDAGRIDPIKWKHHVPFWLSSWNEEDEIALRHMAAIGLETSPGDMPQSRTAYFNGHGRVDFYRVDDPSSEAREEFWVENVYLTADFGDGTVSGLLDEWEHREDGSWVPTDISYALSPASIDGNGFSTSMAPSASCAVESGGACPTMPDSIVLGKFYGPYAAEAGGTIETGQFAFDGANWIGIGGFTTAGE